MKPEKSNKAEVAHHFIKRLAAKLVSDGVWITSRAIHFQLLIDITLVNHGVKDVQYLKIFTPHLIYSERIVWNLAFLQHPKTASKNLGVIEPEGHPMFSR